MKPRNIQKKLFAAAALSAFAVALPAQTGRESPRPAPEQSRTQTQTQTQPERQQGQQQTQTATAHRSSSLINARLTTPAGESLGTINDIAVDLESGRAAFLIVNTGSLLDIKHKAIPPSAIKAQLGEEVVALHLSQEKFQSAPTFSSEEEIAKANDQKIGEVYSHYGVEWEREQPRGQQSTAAAQPRQQGRQQQQQRSGEGSERLHFTQDLFGRQVETTDNQNVGRLTDFFIDLENNRVPFMIVAQENPRVGRIGFDDAYAVPTSAFERVGDVNVVVSASESDFENPGDMTAAGWVSLSDNAVTYPSQMDWGMRGPRQATVLRYTTSASTEGTFAGRQQAPEGARSETGRTTTTTTTQDRQRGATSVQQQERQQQRGQQQQRIGASAGDLSDRVSQSLTQGQPAIANLVTVTAEGGNVTLRGHVATEEQKRQIEQSTRQVNGVESVDNKIEVRR